MHRVDGTSFKINSIQLTLNALRIKVKHLLWRIFSTFLLHPFCDTDRLAPGTYLHFQYFQGIRSELQTAEVGGCGR